MDSTEKSPLLANVRINLRLLPMKLHFFFYAGALGGIIPFLPVLAKDLGITATAVGAIHAIISFSVMFSKPILGAITDYVRNVKMVLIVLVVLCLCSGFPILFIPPIAQETRKQNISSIVTCKDTLMPVNTSRTNFTCLDSLPTEYSASCDLNYKSCLESQIHRYLIGVCNNTSVNATLFNSLNLRNYSILNHSINISSCSCDNITSFFERSNACLLKSNDVEDTNLYGTFQFWTFAILSIIFGVCSVTLSSLTDAASYEILGDESKLYGRQRLWGTVSWGIATLLTGYLNDVIYSGSGTANYSPGFYLMVCLISIDLIILSRSTLKKSKSSLSICKDVSQIFANLEIVTFAVGVFIIGALTALTWQFQFWFLSNLGASQLLLGLTVAMQCLAAEVPFFFAAGKIIDTFGHMNCLIGSFVAYAIRYALYFYLTNPWWVLPIEILHGPTYGVFYATMTSFSNSKATPGTEATMMGILGGLFEGLGVATGSFLGGLGFDTLEGNYTFLMASFVSAVSGILLSFIHYLLKGTRAKQEINPF